MPAIRARQSLRFVMSVTLLIGALLVTQLRSSGEAVPIRQALDTFPTLVGDWRGQEGAVFESEVLNLLKVKDYLLRRYANRDGRSVWLYIAYWDTQRKGAQIHSPKNCLPSSGWEPLEASEMTIGIPGRSQRISVNRYLVQKDRQMEVVFYWYQSQGRAISSELAARLDVVKRAAVHGRTDGALVRISSPVDGNVQVASDRLVSYIQTIYPILGDYLPD